MRKLRLKYVIAPVCMVLIAVVGYAGFLNLNNNTNNNPIIELTGPAKEEGLAKIININKIENMGIAKFDAEVKQLNGPMIPYFEYMSGLEIPKDFDSKENYRAIYTRSDKNSKNYDILHNYEFIYKNTSNNRKITIAFSDKYEPLRDYDILDNSKVSKIGDVELVIGQYNTLYITKFKYNGINFDIETEDITQEELISLLESIIIKEQNNNNKIVEDKDIGMKEQPSEVSDSVSYQEFYAGEYVDENGNNVILLCEDNETNRRTICEIFGITESKTKFVKAKYSYNYLTELQKKISKAMTNKEIPFVTSSALKDDTNNIVVTVTTRDSEDIQKIKALDTIGGAIEIKYSENSSSTEDLEIKEY